MVIKKCLYCNKDFSFKFTKSRVRKYCSRECSAKGIPRHSGQFKKGHVGYWKGKKQSKETINKRIKKGKDHYNWKGGKTLDSSGYVLIHVENYPFCITGNYAFEHRIVMEKHLGRFLKPEEEVHHKDKNRLNNRIKNLRLFKDKSSHMKHHAKIRNK